MVFQVLLLFRIFGYLYFAEVFASTTSYLIFASILLGVVCGLLLFHSDLRTPLSVRSASLGNQLQCYFKPSMIKLIFCLNVVVLLVLVNTVNPLDFVYDDSFARSYRLYLTKSSALSLDAPFVLPSIVRIYLRFILPTQVQLSFIFLVYFQKVFTSHSRKLIFTVVSLALSLYGGSRADILMPLFAPLFLYLLVQYRFSLRIKLSRFLISILVLVMLATSLLIAYIFSGKIHSEGLVYGQGPINLLLEISSNSFNRLNGNAFYDYYYALVQDSSPRFSHVIFKQFVNALPFFPTYLDLPEHSANIISLASSKVDTSYNSHTIVLGSYIDFGFVGVFLFSLLQVAVYAFTLRVHFKLVSTFQQAIQLGAFARALGGAAILLMSVYPILVFSSPSVILVYFILSFLFLLLVGLISGIFRPILSPF